MEERASASAETTTDTANEQQTNIVCSPALDENTFRHGVPWPDPNKLDPVVDEDLTPGRKNLRQWLGKKFKVVITDGRVLVGFFNCTDKDANVVLSMCAEYLEEGKDARILGNVMIPGKHIVSICVDMPKELIEEKPSSTQ